MAFSSCSNLVGGPLPLAAVGETQFPTKRSMSVTTTTKHRALPLQVRSEGKQKPGSPKTFGVSRRDVMLSLPVGTLASLTLLPTEPAEARLVNPEIRKKIFEKLKKIREHFGLSKPKTNDGKEAYPSPPPPPPPPPSLEEKNPQTFPPALPLDPQGNLLVPLPPVEVILP
ncbi:hypothetical protein FF1_011063 [Malus domestica]|uniref:Uncharacterized protein n=1 Tax=Malus domestica TaxID=3750 RepID=A0A498I637_MALDO|nr:hypothetical protein DVH24_040355 [Malus domestica]